MKGQAAASIVGAGDANADVARRRVLKGGTAPARDNMNPRENRVPNTFLNPFTTGGWPPASIAIPLSGLPLCQPVTTPINMSSLAQNDC